MVDLVEKAEADILRALRSRYEKEGFTFWPHPSRDIVPPFLGDYRPDALALSKDKGSVVIEIKARRAGSGDRQLAQIARLVEQQPGWTFRVYYAPNFSQPAYKAPSKAGVLGLVAEVKELQKAGFMRPAFLMAWSALEAFTRALHAREANSERPMMPSEMIGWLSQSGNIDAPTERMLRSMVRTRNALVHGDSSVEIEPYHMIAMISALDALKKELEDE
ncbi:MAG TPA: hypothetical protein VFB02_22230 [Bradyrhizobium sp.]|nr:hypothetical protein [Bradyrhizobium sp.]